MEYYSPIKRPEVLIHSATWINAENIVLSKKSQTQKATHFLFHLYEMSRIGESIEMERLLVDA